MDCSKGLNEEICPLGASKVRDEIVIALDPSDIRKERARRIRDGNKNELGDGYWLWKAVAAEGFGPLIGVSYLTDSSIKLRESAL